MSSFLLGDPIQCTAATPSAGDPLPEGAELAVWPFSTQRAIISSSSYLKASTPPNEKHTQHTLSVDTKYCRLHVESVLPHLILASVCMLTLGLPMLQMKKLRHEDAK